MHAYMSLFGHPKTNKKIPLLILSTVSFAIICLIIQSYLIGETINDYSGKKNKNINVLDFQNIQESKYIQKFARDYYYVAENGSDFRDASTFPITQKTGKANACLVMLFRNQELNDAIHSIIQIQKTFNDDYNYPWVFLNDKPFDLYVKIQIAKEIPGDFYFGTIPKYQWSVPPFVEKNKVMSSIEEMAARRILYGHSSSYRHMCRFFSGFLFRHPLIIQYDYYWRIEPNVEYFCKLDYDPFEFMIKKDLDYGFVITLEEIAETIPTLWSTTRNFLKIHPDYLAENNSAEFLTTRHNSVTINNNIGFLQEQSEYNGCHFWSNFEIASTKFWNSKIYLDFFNYLDQAGGFFYERWGDAPVHSIAVSLFLPTRKVWHFGDIGYYHAPVGRVPKDENGLMFTNCKVKTEFLGADGGAICLPLWEKAAGHNNGSSALTLDDYYDSLKEKDNEDDDD